jgi:hypothetical protein
VILGVNKEVITPRANPNELKGAWHKWILYIDIYIFKRV